MAAALFSYSNRKQVESTRKPSDGLLDIFCRSPCFHFLSTYRRYEFSMEYREQAQHPTPLAPLAQLALQTQPLFHSPELRDAVASLRGFSAGPLLSCGFCSGDLNSYFARSHRFPEHCARMSRLFALRRDWRRLFSGILARRIAGANCPPVIFRFVASV